MYYEDYFWLEEPNMIWNDEIVEEGDLVEIMTMNEIIERYEKTCSVCPDYLFEGIRIGRPEAVLEEKNKIIKTISMNENDIIFNSANVAYYKKMEKIISGKHAVVKKIEFDGSVVLKFLNDKNDDCSYYIYCVPMIKIIEKNYEQNKRVYRELKKVQGSEELIKEMISKVDVKKVKRILSACFQINAKELKGVDKLLKDWALAKQDIYLLFGRELRITSENEFEMSDEERDLMFQRIREKFPVEWFIITEFPGACLFDNMVDHHCNMFCYLQQHFKTLKIGMTFSQLLHDVFKNEELDVEYSKVINTPLVKGYVSISIDPVDYLLMSLNKSGWTSCHTLNSDIGRTFGCYSAGIFSYMCDPSSIIAFKHVEKDEETMYINGTKISALNKAWRQMVYLDIESRAFVASRQYPSENLPASTIVREMIEKLYVNEFEVADIWKVQRGDADLSEYIRDYYEDEDDRLHYNDIYNDYSGALVYNKLLDNKSVVCAEIGSLPICSICGENYLTAAGRPFCWRCEEKLEEYDEDDEEEIPMPF